MGVRVHVGGLLLEEGDEIGAPEEGAGLDEEAGVDHVKGLEVVEVLLGEGAEDVLDEVELGGLEEPGVEDHEEVRPGWIGGKRTCR